MRIVLVGAGHTHMLILKKLSEQPTPGIQWVLVSPEEHFYYSGAFTSYLSGQKSLEAVRVPLLGLLKKAHALGNSVDFLKDSAEGLDLPNQRAQLRSGSSLPYDLLCLNCGGENQFQDLPNLKPFSQLILELENSQRKTLQIVGAGTVGVELALCLAQKFSRPLQLIEESDQILPDAPSKLQSQTMALLKKRKIELFLNSDFRNFPSELKFNATPVKAASWIRDSALEMAGDFLKVSSHLRTSNPQVFAVGEGTQNPLQPWAQNGVTAVRQAPILWKNLLLSSKNSKELHQFQPQKSYLVLMNSGDGRALGFKGTWSLGITQLNWLLKSWIDNRFLNQFRV